MFFVSFIDFLFYIYDELPKETIYMKCPSPTFWENKKNILKWHLLQFKIQQVMIKLLLTTI